MQQMTPGGWDVDKDGFMRTAGGLRGVPMSEASSVTRLHALGTENGESSQETAEHAPREFNMEPAYGTAGANSPNMGMAVTAGYQPKWFWWTKSQEEESKVTNCVVNLFLVLFAASAAAHKILTVDQDVWTGWSYFEILRRVPVDNWHGYQQMLQTNPVFAKMCISGVVYTLGDWSAQTCEGKPFLEFDRPRMIRSGLVGFCLHGSLSHFYYQAFEAVFPYTDWWAVGIKVAIDQTIWSGIWNSIYYTTLGVLRAESPQTIWRELRATFVPMLTAGWKLWPFAHLITYGVVPVEHRLLWVDMVELVWVTMLSMISNEKQEKRAEETEAIVQAIVEQGGTEEQAQAVIAMVTERQEIEQLESMKFELENMQHVEDRAELEERVHELEAKVHSHAE
jgi:protein Mpv17